MSFEIKRSIEHYINQGEILLEQLKVSKLQQKNVQADLGRTFLIEGARLLAVDIFESAKVGRITKKLTRAYLDQQKKKQKSIIEETYNNRFYSWLRNINDFLANISTYKANLKKPNSQQLIGRFSKIEEVVKLETKISRSIRILRGISNKPLIYNQEIKKLTVIEEKQILLPPGSPYTGFRKIEELLRKSTGYIKIIDSYVDEDILDILFNVAKEIPIFLLTAFTGGKGKGKRFVKLCKRFKTERPRFEIRKCDPSILHDRFILTKNNGWTIGSSIKDIGKRMTMITPLTVDTLKNAEELFKQIWHNSKNLI